MGIFGGLVETVGVREKERVEGATVFASFFIFLCWSDTSKTPWLDVSLSHNQSWELQLLGDVVGVREVVTFWNGPFQQHPGQRSGLKTERQK